MYKSESFFLTFFSLPFNNLPSLGGRGWRGGGTEGLYSVHPHPHPPPSKRGRVIGGEISNIFD
jgi:hypothetical protein